MFYVDDLLSILWLGVIMLVMLFGEFGDLWDFDWVVKFIKYVGFDLVEISLGVCKGKWYISWWGWCYVW